MEFDARIPYEKLQGKHVVLGLSGGVDSSVSAALLKENGMHVTALFMKNWEEDDTNSYCAAAKDREDAQKVCAKLGIEHKTINFAAEYWDNVFEICLPQLRKRILQAFVLSVKSASMNSYLSTFLQNQV